MFTLCVCVCVYVCVRACARTCVRARARAISLVYEHLAWWEELLYPMEAWPQPSQIKGIEPQLERYAEVPRLKC